jgi:uncharacterized membrane protein YiaA
MYVVLGSVFILVGIMILMFSVDLWRHPESLNPRGFWYRYFLRDWKAGPRSRKSKKAGLTPKRIRYYALRNTVGGLSLIVAGVLLIVDVFR